MGMNRRKVLVGLGTIVAGGGVAFGSGAFSQVSAQRTIETSTAGDGGAYLSLSGDGNYVSLDGNQVKFTFDQLNENADSEFDNILKITMNAGDPNSQDAIATSYDIYFGTDSNLGTGEALNFQDQSQSDDSTLVGSGNAASISYDSSGWGSVNVRAKFNLTDTANAVGDVPSSVTIVADDGS